MEKVLAKRQVEGVPYSVRAESGLSIADATLLTETFLNAMAIAVRRLVINSTSGLIREVVLLVSHDYHELRVLLHDNKVDYWITKRENTTRRYDEAIRRSQREYSDETLRTRMIELLQSDHELIMQKITEEMERKIKRRVR